MENNCIIEPNRILGIHHLKDIAVIQKEVN